MNPDHQADPSPRESEYVMPWYDAVTLAKEWTSDLPMNSPAYRVVWRLIRAHEASPTRTSPQLSEGMVGEARRWVAECGAAYRAETMQALLDGNDVAMHWAAKVLAAQDLIEALVEALADQGNE